MSDSVWPHRRQPTTLPHPWNSPGKNTGVGCHLLLQYMKMKSESEVAQSCPTLSDPMDCSLPGSSIHGIFQARVLEWGAIAFSIKEPYHISFPTYLYLIRKVSDIGILFYGPKGSLDHPSLDLCLELSSFIPFNHHKSQSQSPSSALLSHSWTWLRACSALPRKNSLYE